MWPVPILGGSWVVISGVISPLKGVISIVTLLITLLLTTHEPPSGLCYGIIWEFPKIRGTLLWGSL